MKSHKITKPTQLIPLALIVLGILAAPCCLVLLVAFIGDRTLLSIVAPYATLADPTLSSGIWFFFLAGIQYPVYGIILAAAWVKSDRYRIMFLLSLSLLIAQHCITAAKASRIAHELILY
jgi:hypothetical protein